MVDHALQIQVCPLWNLAFKILVVDDVRVKNAWNTGSGQAWMYTTRKAVIL